MIPGGDWNVVLLPTVTVHFNKLDVAWITSTYQILLLTVQCSAPPVESSQQQQQQQQLCICNLQGKQRLRNS